MAKATVTVIRQVKAEKPIGSMTGGAIVTEALIHMATSGMTIHARQVGLRRISRMFLQPLERIIVYGSIQNTKILDNFASITTASVRSAGTTIVAGSANNFYGLFIGD